MNDNEKKLFLKGIEIFGIKDWASISKHLLPNWERRQLRKIYYRKIKPTLSEQEEIELLSKFGDQTEDQRKENQTFLRKLNNNNNYNVINNNPINNSHHHNNRNTVKISNHKFDVYKEDQSGFPILSEKQEREVLNNPLKLQRLRTKIKIAMRSQIGIDVDASSCDFFNPQQDIIIPLEVEDLDPTANATNNLIENMDLDDMDEFFDAFANNSSNL